MEIRSFLEKAEDRLAGVRGGLLLFSQGRLSSEEVLAACQRLAQLQVEAEGAGRADIGALAADAAYSIEQATRVASGVRTQAVNTALDLVSKLEAAVLQMPLGSDEFFHEADDLVESAFKGMTTENGAEDFEIDDETLEIFREEASELLSNIRTSLATLKLHPEKTDALWEIRRCCHTLKGAAGIVGLHEASKLAHSVEDLLDRKVEAGVPVSADLTILLEKAVDTLDAVSAGAVCEGSAEMQVQLEGQNSCRTVEVALPISETAHRETSAIHTPPTPVVRVSLDRLDQLLYIASRLASESQNALNRVSEGASASELAELLRGHRALAGEISEGLKQVRLVRFGVLEMRLNRSVQVTCQEEDKKAGIVILDPDVEIDTLIIDAMIEPLLHLIKNAVVHGIEAPETRRLLGKPEKGTISIAVASDGENVSLSVEDDGCGISTATLLEKGIESGLVERGKAERLDDRALAQLIFERGLTTSATLNLNAGRGVGMSIVKESVESRGGTIEVDWEPQQGTKFTLRFPIVPDSPPSASSRDENEKPFVLIVDDSNSIRRMTSKIVEQAGCRAVTAINGADALELLANRPAMPDLILSDVEMPTMDGWQLLDHIKTDIKLASLPVFMVTSLSSEEARSKAARLGANGYFVKPFTVDDLMSVMSELAPNVPADGSV